MKKQVEIAIPEVRGVLLVIWVVSFPFWVKLSSVIIAVSIVLYIYDSTKNRKFIFDFFQYLPVLLFFVIILISLLYSNDISRGWGEVKKKIPLILLPFAFYGVNNKFVPIIKRWFKYALLIYCLLTIIFALYFYPQNNYVTFLSYFQDFINAKWHASYLSLYLLLGLTFAGINLGSQFSSKRIKLISLIEVCVFVCFILMLTSRASKFCVLVLLVIFIFQFIKARKSTLYALCVIFSLSVIGIALSYQCFNKLEHKFRLTSHEEERYKIWPIAILNIEKSPYFGVGVGNVRDLIAEQLYQNGEIMLSKQHFNAHNQFLEILLSLGVIGFLAFLLLLSLPFFRLYNIQEYFYFIVICVIMFSFESILNRQSGVIFFAFFFWFIKWADSYTPASSDEDDLGEDQFIRLYSILVVTLIVSLICFNFLSRYLLKIPQKHFYDLKMEMKFDKSDTVEIFFLNKDLKQFRGDLSQSIAVNGSRDYQKIDFHFVINELKRIRIDISSNPEQKWGSLRNLVLIADGEIIKLDLRKFDYSLPFFNKLNIVNDSLVDYTFNNNAVYDPLIITDDLTARIRFSTIYFVWFYSLFFFIFATLLIGLLYVLRKKNG